MDPRTGLTCVIHKDFGTCKRQIESLWSDVDEICVDIIKNALALCFKSTKISDEVSVETNIPVKPINESQPEEPILTDDQLSKAPAPKKLKLSLHSRKCEHSPHNRRKKDGVGVTENTVSTPGSMAQKPVTHTSQTPVAIVPGPSLETPRTSADSKPTNTTFDIVKSGARPKRSSSSIKPTVAPPETTFKSPTIKMNPALQLLEAKVELSQTSVTESPDIATAPAASSSSSDNKEVTHTSDSPSRLPTQCTAVVAEPTASTELPGPVPSHMHIDSSTFDESISSNFAENDTARIRTSKQTSLGTERSLYASKMRPFFCSAERLGGMSRLNNLNTATSANCADKSSKPHRISQKNSSQMSLLNESKSGTSQPNERSKSVLAMKEQMLAEKQRIYRERLKENADRLRAFQEAKHREREAQKRANEERRLAVKQKAEQLAEMQRAMAENKQRLEKARAQAELDKQKTNTAPKPGCVARINEKENQPLSHPRPPPVSRTAQSQTISKPQPVVRLQPVKPPAAVLKPIQHAQPSIPVVNAFPAAPKPTAATTVPVAQTTVPQASAKTVAQPSVTTEQPHINLDTTSEHETFDMSQLRSDSDSDGEQPARKIPSWSRKGNQNLIDTLRLINNGKFKWPDELLTSSEIDFDIEEIFHGFKFNRKPRSSSAIWSTVGGPFVREH